MPQRQQQLEGRRPRAVIAWHHFNTLSGWRKSAVVNTGLTFAVLLVLLCGHTYLWARSGSLAGYKIIYSGSCAGKGVDRLNTMLHLVINTLSTLVLASSNFFMQVLNAPSRAELDSAHKKASWLEIGVPSPWNAFRVSRFKTVMWILFFLSSVPIHLLFNSSVYSTDYRGTEFAYFVFDESVLAGGAVFHPGTSLSVPYRDFENFTDYRLYDSYDSGNYTWENAIWKDSTWGDSPGLEFTRGLYLETLYPDENRIIHGAVDEIRKGAWHRLDAKTCNSLYSPKSCSGLQSYRNVALILGGSSGWSRSQVWDLPAKESSFWDEYMPAHANNSMWLAQIRSMMLVVEVLPHNGTRLVCDSSWTMHEGLSTSNEAIWSYPLIADAETGIRMTSRPPTRELKTSSLKVEYCLAEPFEAVCHIGLASTLLWVVSVCILLKAVLCFVVVIKLGKEGSLVTPGDVIESFISDQPDYPVGTCLLQDHPLRFYKLLNLLDAASLVYIPEQWICRKRRRWRAVSKRTWLSCYVTFSVGIVLLAYFFVVSYPMTGWGGSFGQDTVNQRVGFPDAFSPTFEQAILIANLPQLFLSFAYLAFNSLFTRLNMAKEWSAMSTRYKALRVTNPRGQQSSTYFLQLPYRYSIPLIMVGILLHWVLSGCIYLLVMEGDYYSSYSSFNSFHSPASSLYSGDSFYSDGTSEGPMGSFVALGFSTKSLLTMLTLSMTLFYMPPIFGWIALPPNSVVVGSNSLAIAAACRVSPLVGQRQPGRSFEEEIAGRQDDEIELRSLMAPSTSHLTRGGQASDSCQDEEERKATLLRVSQSRIKWGVVKMPPSWKDQFNRRNIVVEHISFGLPEDDVQQPIEGHWYA